ncbi:MAG: hypothetical protein HQL51_10885 [Magnetococcales bacterium]|nr:hypothetical protein [Magnetococcales bacterium]
MSTCKTGGGGQCQTYDTNTGRYGSDEERHFPLTRFSDVQPPYIPEYRGDVFRSPQKVVEWVMFFHNVLSLPGVTVEEIQAYTDIFAAEGGMASHPGTGAFAGILQSTLDDLIKRGFLPGIPEGTRNTDLTVAEVVQVYRAYFDDVFHTIGGHDALTRMGSDEFARAAADTMLRHGRGAGAALIQTAINTMRSGAITVDTRMGSGTLTEIQRINANPTQQKTFRNALMVERNALVFGRRSDGTARSGKESDRFRYFEFK